MKRILMASLVALSTTSVAVAHPGHGHPGFQTGLLHQLTSLSHLAVWGLVAFVLSIGTIGLLIVRRRRTAKQRALKDPR